MKRAGYMLCIILVLSLSVICGCSVIDDDGALINSINESNDPYTVVTEKGTKRTSITYMNMADREDMTYIMYMEQTDEGVRIAEFTDEAYINYLMNGKMHFLYNSNDFYTIIMSDLMYEYYLSSYLDMTDYSNDTAYTLVSDSTKGQTRTVKYQFDITDAIAEDFTVWGLAAGDTVTVTYNLGLDMLISTMTMAVDSTVILDRTEEYGIGFLIDNISEGFFGSDETVKVEVWYGFGTDDASSTIYEIPKGSFFGYDFTDTGMDLYYDSGYTSVYTYLGGALDMDITLYMAPLQADE
jgi:hypothetical protein